MVALAMTLQRESYEDSIGGRQGFIGLYSGGILVKLERDRIVSACCGSCCISDFTF